MPSDCRPDMQDLRDLCAEARRQRDQVKGRIVSYSPKVFIPLTQLCRDFCGYCAFRQEPGDAEHLYMTPEKVLEVARAGQRAGCREALFVLGERPEKRYPEARRWLRERKFDSTVHYLADVCALVLRETKLYPHCNAGTLTCSELADLKPVNASMGLMLESLSEALGQPGGPHERAPSKRPAVRLRTLELAGRLKIPFTTGLLVGIGETADDRVRTLTAIRRLHEKFGHIQEVIIQNFRAKPSTPMARCPEAGLEEMMETAAQARLILGGDMNIQVPPNLNSGWWRYLEAGVNDWGGISPVTIDHVNPEAAWPQIESMRRRLEASGFRLRARFPVYPEYILRRPEYLPPALLRRLRREADPDGYPSRASAARGVVAVTMEAIQ